MGLVVIMVAYGSLLVICLAFSFVSILWCWVSCLGNYLFNLKLLSFVVECV